MIQQRREWHPTPVFWPGESHRQRSLAGYDPWDHKDLDMTEQLTLSQIFRGNFCISPPVFCFFFKLHMGLFLLMSWTLIQYHGLILTFPPPSPPTPHTPCFSVSSLWQWEICLSHPPYTYLVVQLQYAYKAVSKLLTFTLVRNDLPTKVQSLCLAPIVFILTISSQTTISQNDLC